MPLGVGCVSVRSPMLFLLVDMLGVRVFLLFSNESSLL